MKFPKFKFKFKWKSKTSSPKLTKLQRALKNINKKAMRAGAKLVLQAVKARVPVDSGALRQSLTTKVDSVKGETSAYALVGPRSKFVKAVGGRPKKPSRYAHLIEKGRFRRPFLMPSWQANKGRFLAEVERVTSTEINKVMNG